MLSDTHIHTSFSGDSKTPPRDQAMAAIALGMDEICITDHHDYGSREMTHIDFYLDIPAYLPAIRALAQEFEGKLTIRTGIELGLMCREKTYLTKLASKLPVDYIIGSNHFVDGTDVYERAYFEGRSEMESYRRYFESTLNRVREMDCFDSLGHLDYVVRYGPGKNQNYRPFDYREVTDEILKLLIERGKGLECNTGGFKAGLGHPHPQEEILCRYRELGGEIITVGSDAHRAPELGGYFKEAAEILKKCGFRYYAVYRGRKPYFKTIE